MKINCFKAILAIGCLAAASSANADPTTAAPTPIQDADNVVSVYSDAYTSTGFSFGEWGSGTAYTAETVNGDNIAKFVTTSYQYFGWQFPTVDAVPMSHFHIDFYSDTAFSLNFYIIASNDAGATIDTISVPVSGDGGVWTSFEVNLSQFTALDLSTVFQFKFNGMGATTLWIDNAYFYRSTVADSAAPTWDADPTVTGVEGTIPTLSVQASDLVASTVNIEASTDASFSTVLKAKKINSGTATSWTISDVFSAATSYTLYLRAVDWAGNVSEAKTVEFTTEGDIASAPVPTVAADKVISLYSDAYTAATSFNKGSWGDNTVQSAMVINGSDNVLKVVTGSSGYLGWEFASTLDISSCSYVHIDLYALADCSLNLSLIWGSESPVNLAMTANQWTSFDIPLTEWPNLVATNVYQLKFSDIMNQTFYIDNVYFYAGEDDTEAPAWSGDPTVAASYSSAVLTVNATDNISTTITYEASMTEDFAEVAATATGTAGSDATLTLTGLTASTSYTAYVRAKDAAGNLSDVKTVGFTTTEAPVLEEVTYYGTAGGSDESNWIDKANGYFPTITYTMVTTPENQLVFTAKMSEVYSGGMSVELWCDQLSSPGYAVMTAVDGADATYTATIFDANEKTRGDAINFRFRFPMTGGAPMTQNIYLTVGAQNDPPEDDTEAPSWTVDPTVTAVGSDNATISLAVTDNSGTAYVTATDGNGYEDVIAVTADGSTQTIELAGLTASTAYSMTLSLADAAGNAAAETKTVEFTTEEAVALDELVLTIALEASGWSCTNADNAYAPSGSVKIIVGSDNRLTFNVTLSETRDDFAQTLLYIHNFEEGVSLVKSADSDLVYTYTTTNAIADRSTLMYFHMYFVYTDGTSTYAAVSFTPADGDVSGVEAVASGAAVKAYGSNGAIRVKGAAGKKVAVYSLSGALLSSKVAASDVEAIPAPAGVYVVVVDGKATKVVL